MKHNLDKETANALTEAYELHQQRMRKAAKSSPHKPHKSKRRQEVELGRFRRQVSSLTGVPVDGVDALLIEAELVQDKRVRYVERGVVDSREARQVAERSGVNPFKTRDRQDERMRHTHGQDLF